MSTPLAVAIAVMLVDVLVARFAASSSWLSRSPALGIAIWQALTVSFLMSCFAASAVLAAPLLLRVPVLEGFIHACAPLLDRPYTSALGVSAGAVGTVFLLLLVSRLTITATREVVRLRTTRTAHHRDLQLVARPDFQRKVSIIDHPAKAAYCIQGRPDAIVLTTGALDALTDDQIQAVIAHERAHLRGRHGWVLTAARVMAHTLPGLQLTQIALSQIIQLVEMRADQVALRSTRRVAMAQALVQLSGSTVPTGALGAGGAAAARLERLARPDLKIPRHQAALAQVGAITLLVAPLTLATAPLAHAVLLYCGVSNL